MHFKRFAAAVSAVAVVVLSLLFLFGCAPKGENKGGDLLARVQAKGEITVALEDRLGRRGRALVRLLRRAAAENPLAALLEEEN